MKVTKARLKELIKEELETLSERKLPPKEDPEIVSQWEQVKPALEQLMVTFTDSPTGPHYNMSKHVEMFIRNIDASMGMVSYAETERIEKVGRTKPVSSFSINEDVMDQNVIDGMIQIMNNFGIASWPALAGLFGMTFVELKDQLKSYAAKKAGVNIKTR
jgi:hypothetical protein